MDVYLFLFMGQSNMAGRGVAALAPAVREGWAYEYRAITRPDALMPLEEPFGLAEDNPEGVFEPGRKTGSMVAALVNAAYPLLETPIVGISCAKGGSSINEWLPDTPYFNDALERLAKCRKFLAEQQHRVIGTYMFWCQGCTDGDYGMNGKEYREKAEKTLLTFLEKGAIERCFLVRIGNHRDEPQLYAPIREAQEWLCADNEKIVMVSRCLASMAERGLMKDVFHYMQPAYNEAGNEAGRNAAEYIRNNRK